MTESVKLTREAEIAWVMLNRPQAYNAFDRDLVEALAAQLSTLAVDPEVRAVVISGAGKAFCAGGDLKYFLGSPVGPARIIHAMAGSFHQAVIEIRRMAKPVIAAINGVAAGGGFSLALACDFRVMAESATLKQAYTSAGLSLDGGGSFTLPRMVGPGPGPGNCRLRPADPGPAGPGLGPGDQDRPGRPGPGGSHEYGSRTGQEVSQLLRLGQAPAHRLV